MRLLITGAGGQVGLALAGAAERSGITHRGFRHDELDITDRASVQRVVAQHAGPTTILINLAAWTDVDGAQVEPEGAFRINALGAEVVARACEQAAMPFIHLSTDYVFDGKAERPFAETDPTRPLNVYGQSKLAGEDGVRRATRRHLIVRTSWVFGSTGRNFVQTMLGLAGRADVVRVVTDEAGCPTGTGELARVLLRLASHILAPDFAEWGTYHFCGSPPVSRADFARAIFTAAARHGRISPPRVQDITSAEYSAVAPRPRYSVLECGRIREVFGVQQPDWSRCLERVVDDAALLRQRD